MAQRARWMAVAAGTLFLLGQPWPALAQASHSKFEVGVDYGLGGTKADNLSGFTFTLGPYVRVGPVFAVFNPIEGTFSGLDSTYPYEARRYSDGDIAWCEDTVTGYVADPTKCEGDPIEFKNVPTLSAGILVPKEIFEDTRVFFGAGRRLSPEFDSWFVTSGVVWYKAVVRTNIGPGYFLISIGGGWDIPALTR